MPGSSLPVYWNLLDFTDIAVYKKANCMKGWNEGPTKNLSLPVTPAGFQVTQASQ